jgi:hypothetical protein
MSEAIIIASPDGGVIIIWLTYLNSGLWLFNKNDL